MCTHRVLKAGGPWGPPQMTAPRFRKSLTTTIGGNFDDRCRSRGSASFRGKWLAEGHQLEALETQIGALKEVVANAKATIEQRRQESDVLPSQMAKQLAPNDKLQAELDQLRAGIKSTGNRWSETFLAVRLQWAN